MSVDTVARAQGIPNFFTWWFVEHPKYLWSVTKALTRKTLVFFSVPVLIGTLFAPWKRDLQRTSNLPLDLAVKGVIDNIISRLVGFVVRSVTIIVALGAVAGCFLGGVATMLFWTGLPAVAVLITWMGVAL